MMVSAVDPHISDPAVGNKNLLWLFNVLLPKANVSNSAVSKNSRVSSRFINN